MDVEFDLPIVYYHSADLSERKRNVMTTVKLIWTVILKDFRIERNSKELFTTMFMYAAAVLVIFHFALQSAEDRIGTFSGGILWIAFTFAATLGLNRVYSYERENGIVRALSLIPCDKGVLYLGKCFSMLAWLTLAEFLIVPLYGILFNVSLWDRILPLSGVILLGSLGYVAAGTLLAAVSMNTRMKENFLPLILFPVTIPLLIASVEATQIILNAPPAVTDTRWITVLAAYDTIILTASYLLYGYVMEE